MVDNFDVTLVKGDTARWSYFFLGLTSGVTFDFTGSTLYLQVRNGYSPATLIASYSKYVSSDAELFEPVGFTGGLSSATGGTVNMCLGYTYSSNLSTDRISKYDLKVITSDNSLTTILRGNLQVLPEVTDI